MNTPESSYHVQGYKQYVLNHGKRIENSVNGWKLFTLFSHYCLPSSLLTSLHTLHKLGIIYFF